MKPLQDTHLIFEAAVVKRLLRTGWQVLGDNEESLGEHTFMTCVIAYLIACKTNDINMEKVLIMAIFHDFHEGRTGDVDKIAKLYITRDEARANKDIFETLDSRVLEYLTEYEAKKSSEARIVYEANVLALLVEVKLLVEKGNVNAKEWLEGNKVRVKLPASRELAELIATTNSQSWWQDIRDELHQTFENER